MPATHGVTKSHRRGGHIGAGCDKVVISCSRVYKVPFVDVVYQCNIINVMATGGI